MKIVETGKFKKSSRSLEEIVRRKMKKQLRLFMVNAFHPSLNTEKLKPKKDNVWSFRIDKSYRVIFTFLKNQTVVLLNVGPHDIYKKS